MIEERGFPSDFSNKKKWSSLKTEADKRMFQSTIIV